MNHRFFTLRADCTAGNLGSFLGLPVTGNSNIEITDVVSAVESCAGGLCFVNDEGALVATGSFDGAVVITTPDLAKLIPDGVVTISCASPRKAFLDAVSWLVLSDSDGITSNSIQSDATIDPSAVISPLAMIGAGVEIGADTIVAAGAVIHNNVVIGARCRIGSNAVISHSLIADDVSIHAGSVIGGTGFGFEMTEDGPVVMPHLGIVRIGIGTRIGANSTIDRGNLAETVIGNHVMIDNLVQIGHNCVIGDRTIMASQVGIAGSTIIGSSVVMGGQVGIADHLTIGNDAVLMARSGVTKDVLPGTKIAGFPGEDAGKYWRDQAKLRGLLRRSKTEK